MRKSLPCLTNILLSALLLLAVVASASAQDKDDDRLRNCGSVLKEILDVFAGVSLEGSTIGPDNDDNRHLYGREFSARSIVLSGTVAVPPAEQLISTLDATTPNHRP